MERMLGLVLLGIAAASMLLSACDPNAGEKQREKRVIKACEELAVKQGSPRSSCDKLREQYKEKWGDYPTNT